VQRQAQRCVHLWEVVADGASAGTKECAAHIGCEQGRRRLASPLYVHQAPNPLLSAPASPCWHLPLPLMSQGDNDPLDVLEIGSSVHTLGGVYRVRACPRTNL